MKQAFGGSVGRLRRQSLHSEFSVGLECCHSYLSDVLNPAFAEFGKNLLRCDPLTLQIPTNPLPVLNERKRWRLDETTERLTSVCEPIERNVPEDKRSDQHDPVGDRLVFSCQGILRSISDQNDKQDIGHARGSTSRRKTNRNVSTKSSTIIDPRRMSSAGCTVSPNSSLTAVFETPTRIQSGFSCRLPRATCSIGSAARSQHYRPGGRFDALVPQQLR